MRNVRWWYAAVAAVAIVFGSARAAHAGHVLFDVADHQVLEAADADAVIAPGRVADLLLVAVLRERLASGELSLADRVTILPVAGDRGPHLAATEPIEIGDLLQLLLLSDSRTAAKTLAWAAGPSIGRCLTRMQQVISRLPLTRTTLPDDWPFAATGTPTTGSARRGSTTARELGRLALVVTSDPELRRRLSLDGVPISDGGVIARATAPLIATHVDSVAPALSGSTTGARLALAERDNLGLLAVTTGPQAGTELSEILARGFQRYRRIELVREGQMIGPTVRVRGGIIPTFNAVAGEPWAITMPSVAPSGLSFRLQLPAEIEAPVEVHQPLGELVVEENGRVLAVVPLVAPQAIAPSGWLDTARRAKAP
jgi:D-alanyl-D-alanine carboxypeptidase